MDNDIGVQAIIEAAKNIKDDELWNLDVTLAALILPYMKKFREVHIGHPSTLPSDEAWDEILDDIVWSFENYEISNPYSPATQLKEFEEYGDRVTKGIDLFAKWFGSLWI